MSNGYTLPYESLNSTAKLIKLPNRGMRSKSVGRNFWNRLLSKGQLSQSTLSDGEPRRRTSESPSPTSRRPQDLNSTITVQNNMKFSPSPSVRTSRSNSRSSRSSSIAPEPTPRTSISRNSFSESETNPSIVNNGSSIIINNNPLRKTRTTVTVHLSKSSKTSSTPNLLEANNSLTSETFESNNSNTNESLSQSLTNVRNSFQSENSQESLRNSVSSINGRTNLNRVTLESNRTNIRNFNNSENNRQHFNRSEKGRNFATLENSRTTSRRFATSPNSRTNEESFITSKTNRVNPNLRNSNLLSSSSSRSDLEEEPELNSLQVFRQPKYKERNKALRRIKQLEHLNQNDMCDEVVNQLGRGIQPNYENQHSLKLVDFINKEGFVTTLKDTSSPLKQPPKKPVPKPVNLNRVRREHIYSEIHEAQLNTSRDLLTPTFQKKVTFSTFHDPIQEGDPFSQNKKILPAKFWGIVQVTQALRSRTDDERRRIAGLCYHAILTGSSISSKFFGKVDNSRWGEVAYVLLMENSFEVRDSEGFLAAQHEFTDVSVVYQPEEDPNIFVYIGRCKLNGRIGIALRLNKTKYTETLLSAFKNNKI